MEVNQKEGIVTSQESSCKEIKKANITIGLSSKNYSKKKQERRI